VGFSPFTPQLEMAPRGSPLAMALSALCGVAAACIVLRMTSVRSSVPVALLGYGPLYPQQQQLAAGLPFRENVLGPKAASYVRRWDELAQAAVMSPQAQISELRAQGVPVIFPSLVTDASGKAVKTPSTQGLFMKKDSFNVVPASQSSKLACKCESCDPLAGFPPVCTGCACEEAMKDGAPNPDVFMIGHTRACAEDKCEDLDEEGGDDEASGSGGSDDASGGSEEGSGGSDDASGGSEEGSGGSDDASGGSASAAVNALLDFPECEWWACYDKEGWFCACTCPGQGCL
jgi:uncharacterized membrane protein YgcG